MQVRIPECLIPNTKQKTDKVVNENEKIFSVFDVSKKPGATEKKLSFLCLCSRNATSWAPWRKVSLEVNGVLVHHDVCTCAGVTET